jgi:hypothetical protein
VIRSALKHGAELVVRRVQDAGKRVEARRGEEGIAFDAPREIRGKGGRKAARKPIKAAGSVLVDVGMPRGGERDALFPSKVSSEYAELARAGDVDDVRLKTQKLATYGVAMSPEQRIKLEIFFDSDGDTGTWQFKSAEVAGFFK